MATDELTLLFLGTGGGDWPKAVPPEEMGYSGDRDYRRLCAAVVDGHILVDCGPTVPSALATFGVDPRALTDVLITHSHWDHLDAGALEAVAGRRGGAPPLRLWGEATALRQLPPVAGVVQRPVRVGRTIGVGACRVEVLAGNHHVTATGEQTLHYLFDRGGTRLLYATDGTWLAARTWMRLAEISLDAVVWDATFEELMGVSGHNCLSMNVLMTRVLRAAKVLQPDALVLLTHLSKELQLRHAELEGRVGAEGMTPAYDGMVVRVGARAVRPFDR